MSEEFLTDERVKSVRRLLYVTLGFAVVLLLLALPLVLGDYRRYGLIVALIGVVLGVAAGLALRAVANRADSAKRLSILTGALTILLSVPLIPVWIGLLTVITGIGTLVVVLAPERDAQ
jgi:CDP-diglyceride synthetase